MGGCFTRGRHEGCRTGAKHADPFWRKDSIRQIRGRNPGLSIFIDPTKAKGFGESREYGIFENIGKEDRT